MDIDRQSAQFAHTHDTSIGDLSSCIRTIMIQLKLLAYQVLAVHTGGCLFKHSLQAVSIRQWKKTMYGWSGWSAWSGLWVVWYGLVVWVVYVVWAVYVVSVVYVVWVVCVVGWSAWSGWSGRSGWSGLSGWSGWSGWSVWSGWSEWSGRSLPRLPATPPNPDPGSRKQERKYIIYKCLYVCIGGFL
jgi:hypothetical protein